MVTYLKKEGFDEVFGVEESARVNYSRDKMRGKSSKIN
jgi:hypothetical protein